MKRILKNKIERNFINYITPRGNHDYSWKTDETKSGGILLILAFII